MANIYAEDKKSTKKQNGHTMYALNFKIDFKNGNSKNKKENWNFFLIKNALQHAEEMI